MMRTINIILIGGMLAGAAFVYHLKYDAERVNGQMSKMARKIEQERQAIATLKAEWSLLNQPKRLQELTERYHTYLDLDPLDPNQIGTIDDIPFRQPSEPQAPKPGEKVAAVKPVDLTGSVKKAPADKGGKPADKAPPVPKGVDPRPNDPINSILR